VVFVTLEPSTIFQTDLFNCFSLTFLRRRVLVDNSGELRVVGTPRMSRAQAPVVNN